MRANIKWISKEKPRWSDKELMPRNKDLIFANADWKMVSHKIYVNNISSYIGIGVTDCCRFGGNKEYVNKIEYNLYDKKANIINYNHSEYWITDHFSYTEKELKEYKTGEYINSYPFRFRKITSLLPKWVFYGGPYDGAHLFQIV